MHCVGLESTAEGEGKAAGIALTGSDGGASQRVKRFQGTLEAESGEGSCKRRKETHVLYQCLILDVTADAGLHKCGPLSCCETRSH